MKKYHSIPMAALATVLASFCAGCGLPDTSAEILQDFTKELKTPFVYTGRDIDKDPCLYPLLKRLWETYYYRTSFDEKATFRMKLIEQTDRVELRPSTRVVRYTGHANVLYCEIGSYCMNDDGPGDRDFCVLQTCGRKTVDDEMTAEGDERPVVVNISRGRTLVIGDEYGEITGDFRRYRVRNLQREFKSFTTINDPVFQRWLAQPSGELFNLNQPYIRDGGSLAGRHCADPDTVSLKDLVN